MAEPSEAMQAKARELLKLITSGGYVDYPHRRRVVATFLTELLAEARASAEGKWIAVGDATTPRDRAILGADREGGIHIYEFDANGEDLTPSKMITHWRDLPPLPPAPKASGR